MTLCHLTEESHDCVTWLELVMFVMLRGVKFELFTVMLNM